MGVRRALILFADIIGCSEISNNFSIQDYDKFITQFHEISVKTRELLFPHKEYSVEEIESSIRGDEICLILHSGKDIQKDYFTSYEEEKDKTTKDITNSILFAIGLKLMWLISDYNKDRIKCSLLPRELAIGINTGPVMFFVHPATGREKSSEGYAINLAKRVESVSREGIHSKIFVCKEFKYICDENHLPIEFDGERIFDLKGISPSPYLHEIKDITDSKIVIESSIMNELQKLSKEEIELFYKTARINEQEFWLRKLVGYLLLASKDKRAIGLLKKEEVVNNLIEAGNAYYHLNDYDEAISNYRKVLDIDRQNYFASLNIGLAYSQKGEFDKSIKHLQKALEINPESDRARINMAYTYRSCDEFDKAIECLQKALEINPESEDALVGMAEAYRGKGQFDEAITYAHKALKINPKSDDAYTSIGHIHNEKGQPDNSIEYFQKALEIDPKNISAHIGMGIAYRKKDDLDKSFEYLQKAFELNPNIAVTNYNLACIKSLKKDNSDLYRLLQRAFKINKKYKEDALKDPDFEFVKNEEEFKKLTSE